MKLNALECLFFYQLTLTISSIHLWLNSTAFSNQDRSFRVIFLYANVVFLQKVPEKKISMIVIDSPVHKILHFTDHRHSIGKCAKLKRKHKPQLSLQSFGNFMAACQPEWRPWRLFDKTLSPFALHCFVVCHYGGLQSYWPKLSTNENDELLSNNASTLHLQIAFIVIFSFVYTFFVQSQ